MKTRLSWAGSSFLRRYDAPCSLFRTRFFKTLPCLSPDLFLFLRLSFCGIGLGPFSPWAFCSSFLVRGDFPFTWLGSPVAATLFVYVFFFPGIGRLILPGPLFCPQSFLFFYDRLSARPPPPPPPPLGSPCLESIPPLPSLFLAWPLPV